MTLLVRRRLGSTPSIPVRSFTSQARSLLSRLEQGGLIVLVISPDGYGSANQTLAATMAMALAIGIVGNPDDQGGQAGAVDAAFLVLAVPPLLAALAAHPWRFWRRNNAVSFLARALIATPALWYGIQQALVQRNTWPPLADPHHQAHWYAMAVATFAVVLRAVAAAFGGRGQTVAAITVGLGAAAIAAVWGLSFRRIVMRRCSRRGG